jgi:heme oxygenase
MINAQSLSERLRRSTEALHLQAERSGYIRQILRKRASQEGYGLFLRSLEPAYQALELGLREQAGDDVLASFDWPVLFRHEAILGDLSAVAGSSWKTTYALMPEAEAYAERIRRIRNEAPHRLLGHAYVRYIGDLSGGQIVKAILEEAPGLTAGMMRFYDFDDIDDVEAYKQNFRNGLDRIGERVERSDDIVDEALIAFQLNIDLSLAVAGRMAPA